MKKKKKKKDMVKIISLKISFLSLSAFDPPYPQTMSYTREAKRRKLSFECLLIYVSKHFAYIAWLHLYHSSVTLILSILFNK